MTAQEEFEKAWRTRNGDNLRMATTATKEAAKVFFLAGFAAGEKARTREIFANLKCGHDEFWISRKYPEAFEGGE